MDDDKILEVTIALAELKAIADESRIARLQYGWKRGTIDALKRAYGMEAYVLPGGVR